MDKVKLRTVGQVTHTYIIKELLCPKCGAREEKRYRDDEKLRKFIKCKKCYKVFELCE